MVCRNVGDRYFSISDVNLECYGNLNEVYKNLVVPYTNIVILIISIFLPILLIYLIKKNKKLD